MKKAISTGDSLVSEDSRDYSRTNWTNQNLNKSFFLTGVFLTSFSLLVFQIVQTRILSVIAWYYLAFFGISMAMLGMTVGAVYVYLKCEILESKPLHAVLAWNSLLCGLSIAASLIIQLSLITAPTISATTVAAWIILIAAMSIPYVFGGIVISLALTKSPFPIGQVYGVDLLGAALGCISILFLLYVFDAPSAILFSGVIALSAGYFFGIAGYDLKAAPMIWLKRPTIWMLILCIVTAANAWKPALGLRPILVKETVERFTFNMYEKWNSFSRIMVSQPITADPYLWAPSSTMPKDNPVQQVALNIDGSAGTVMFNFDGTVHSIDFLKYDLVNLAYSLGQANKVAIIGVGGGRDILSAHLFGAREIVGVELNPIFVDLLLKHPFYREFSGLSKLPSLRLYVDDARSWFASTDEKFDFIQMSMIDTWAATGAGAFSLSENGLYTLEGWRGFLKTLSNDGIFTVSRWYSPDNTDETGRMISLATAALLDMGASDARQNIFVARSGRVATLVLSKKPFSAGQLKKLQDHIDLYHFSVLMSPNHPSESELLNSITRSSSINEINSVADVAYLDLSVPTDNRPFFFNQLKLSRISVITTDYIKTRAHGVIAGNLVATAVLVLILLLSLLAVVATIVFPLGGAINQSRVSFVAVGTSYFFLIGVGFMLSEISLLQYFSVYLGHPVYSLGVCLFSLILASGIGSLSSKKLKLDTVRGMLVWGGLVSGYLLLFQANVGGVFEATTDHGLITRVIITIALITPLGFLLGCAFPVGMQLVTAIDSRPAPWFWGINGAAGVLASAAAVMISMNFGINITVRLAAVFYITLVPVAIALISQTKS